MPRVFLSAFLSVFVLSAAPVSAEVLKCDADFDGDIDRVDLSLIFAARNQAATGPDDPRDADSNGVITVLDGRQCSLRCTLPGCASPPVNAAPVADAGDDQTVDLGETVTLDGSGSSDADGDALTFAWQFISTPAGSSAVLSSSSASMPTFVADTEGDYLVELIVNDGAVDSAPDEVVVVTVPGNTAPVADAGPDQSALVNDVVTLDGSGSSDVDGDALSYAWNVVSRPGGSAAVLSDSTAVMPTITIDLPGTYVVELVVDDGTAGSFPDQVEITTDNTPPVADAGPDQTVGLSDNVQLDGSGSSDADGDPLSFDWSLTSAPAGSAASLDNSSISNPSFTADVAGTYVGQLIVNDGAANSLPDTVVIDTSNTQPVADAGADQTVQVGDTVDLDGTGSSDADGDGLTFAWSFASQPSGSSATINNPNSSAASFDADVEGLFVVQLIVNDGTVDSDPDTTTITVNVEPNDPPVAENDSASTDEDTPVSVNVLSNDNDPDGDPIQIDSVGAASNGGVAINGNQIDYTPDPDFNGADSFTYTITDGDETDSATVSVTVNPINDDPVANDDSDTVDEDVAVTVFVLDNDSDVDGDVLSVVSISDPANGSVVNNTSSITYTPDADFTGFDTFSYTVDDGNGGQDSADVSIDVGGVNDDPVLEDDSATTDEDTPVDIDVLANDSDPDGDAVSIVSVTQGSNGAVAINGSILTYTPNTNFNGADLFTYSAEDGNGGMAMATVNVTVDAVNDDPVAGDDNEATDEETLVTVNVLGNDDDVDGDILTITSVSDPANGSAVNNGTSIDYTPDNNFSGVDTFTYTVDDGNGGTDSATVTIDVGNTNDDPVVADDSATTDEDVAVEISVLANDSDPDGDTLTVSAATNGSNGTVTTNGTTVTYTPDLNFNGADSFTYTADDGNGGQADATVSVTVDPVNDDPVANDDSEATDEDMLVPVNVLGNDDDVDGDTLTIDSVSDPANGSTVINGSNVDYTPDTGFDGVDTFTYTISDGNGGTDSATVTVTVSNVDAPPVADAGLDQSVLTTDIVQLDGSGSSDPDGDTLTYAWSVVSGPSGSTVNFSDPAAASPTVSFSDLGSYVLQLSVTAGGQSDSDTVAVTVSQAPSISISNTSVSEGDAATTTASLSVSLTAPVNRVVTVQYATADGSALLLDNDYVANSGTVTFPANTAAPQTIDVVVNGDTDIEPNETVLVNLTNAVNAIIADAQGQVTIVNDDAAANMQLLPSTVNVATFSVRNISVNLSASAGVGGVLVTLNSSDTDIATVPASVTVPEGLSSAQIPVTTLDTAGGVTITASASGFSDALATVNVVARGINISLDEPLVGVGRSVGGTVSLTQSAPAGGVTLDLASDSAGIATVSPVTVTIPEGDSTATFSVDGVAVGIAQISASAQGYATDSVAATVTNNLINLGLLNAIAPGQTSGIALSITNPAPPGGLTVNFVSSDPSIATVTPSITIDAGQQLPLLNPQVTGVNVGTITVTATAAGFAPDTRDVDVTIVFDFNPSDFVVVETNTNDITLNLSAPAPVGDLIVPLSIADPSIATVPASVTVPAGQTSVAVPVSGLIVGDTVLSTNLPGTTDGVANVSVTSAPPINATNTSIIGDDLQVAVGGSLGVPAPAGGVSVTFTSPDPSRLQFALTPTGAGSATVVRTVNAGQSGIAAVYAHALDDNGTIDYTVSAPGYATDTNTVTFQPSGIDINSPASINTTSFSTNTALQMCAWRLTPGTLTRAANQSIRGGISVEVPVASSDTDVGVIVDTPATFNGGTNCIFGSNSAAFDPVGAGTATVSITQPAGFDIPATRQSIVATVTAPNVQVPVALAVGEDLQTSFNVTLQSAPPSPVDITVTVTDPTRAIISDSGSVVGGNSVTFVGVTGTFAGSISLQGLAAGNTTVVASAPGYTDDTVDITVDPSGFDINSPGNFSTQTFAGNRNIQLCAWRLNPSTLARAANQQVRAGLLVSVPIASSDTNVGVMTSPAVDFGGGIACVNGATQFDPINAGTTDISIAQPANFETPAGSSPRQSITATVTAPNVNVPATAIVGDDLQSSVFISLQNTPPSPVDVTVTIDDPGVAVISTGNTIVGGNSITFPGVTSTSVGSLWVQGLSEGTATITTTAQGYNSATTAVTIVPSGFDINSPGDFTTQTFAANRSMQICAWRLTPGTLQRAQNQQIRAGLTVDVPINSSDTNVGVMTVNPVPFPPGLACATGVTFFDPLSNGTADISLTTPSGFDTPGGTFPRQQITATVVAPIVSITNNVTVGSDLQVAVNVSLQNIPPDPVDVTITSSSAAITTLSDDAQLAGGQSVTFNDVTTTFVGTIYVQGRAIGNAQLTGQAAGYSDSTTTVEVQPSGFDINSPGDFTTGAGSGNRNIQICAWRLDPVFLNRLANQGLRGGLNVGVPVTSSDTNVGTITASPVQFTPTNGCQLTQFDPANPGNSIISISSPGGFETPSLRQSINVTVTP